MRKVRNYNKLVNELLNLNIPLRIELIGYLNYDEIYPMIAFKHITKMAKKNIVIVTGQHGDEYFAVHVLINWLKQLKLEDYSDFNFYRNSEVQELAVLFDYIPINLDLYLDVHGDTGKKSVYCYERKPDGQKSIAEKALLENDSVFPYERSQTIYREKVHNGVIYKPEHDRSLDDFMGNRGIAYTVTLELPKLCDGQQRMNGGIKLINSILKNFKEK